MRRALAASVPLLAASCVIIIEPGSNNTPVPIPPLSCSIEAITAEAPIVHIYFAMRIERSTINLAAMRAEQRAAEAGKLEQIKKQMEEVLANSPKFGAIKSQIKLDMTPDGLRIQIVDEQSRPMFDSGSAVVKPYMRELLREIGAVLAEVPNRLTLEGHTDAQAFAGDRGGLGYGNWELSADRANASRRELIAGSLPPERILRVQGLASSVPFERDNPLSPSNRRISIIVMNRDAEDRFFQKSTDETAAPTEAAASAAEAEAPTAPSISNPNAR